MICPRYSLFLRVKNGSSILARLYIGLRSYTLFFKSCWFVLILVEDTRLRLGRFLPILGGSIIGALSVYEVFSTLSALGQSIFGDVVIGSALKEFFSFQIFFGLSSMVLALIGSPLLMRGHSKASATAGVLSTFLGVVSVRNPSRYGYDPPTALIIGCAVGIALILGGAVSGYTSSRRRVIEVSAKVLGIPLLRSIEVATTAVFSALYAALILLVFVPSPTGG